jgi:hypothetical protein
MVFWFCMCGAFSSQVHDMLLVMFFSLWGSCFCMWVASSTLVHHLALVMSVFLFLQMGFTSCFCMSVASSC